MHDNPTLSTKSAHLEPPQKRRKQSQYPTTTREELLNKITPVTTHSSIHQPNATSTSNSNPVRLGPVQRREANLGEYIRHDARAIQQHGFERAAAMRRSRSDFHPGVSKLPHPAARYLNHLRLRGAKVAMHRGHLKPHQRKERLRRGPHKSAHEYVEFLRGELLDFVRKGFWMVVPWQTIIDHPNLFISPMGVVPQRNRRPRVIVDYSFFGINADTVRLAPEEAMQFGKALQRILEAIVTAHPKYGPVHMMKVDISDGFYRIWLNLQDCPRLAVSVPPLEGTEPLLAVPMVLPMGWTESPPYFCSATETVADLANHRVTMGWNPMPHHLDQVADTVPAPEAESANSGTWLGHSCVPAQRPTTKYHNT